jgi:hypothetical protein
LARAARTSCSDTPRRSASAAIRTTTHRRRRMLGISPLRTSSVAVERPTPEDLARLRDREGQAAVDAHGSLGRASADISHGKSVPSTGDRDGSRQVPVGEPARVCAPDLGVGDDGSGRAGDDVGGRPGGRGTVMVAEGRGRGAGLELVVAAVMWAISRVGSVSGDRSGWAAASWSKTWPGRAQLARLQRRHLGTHAQLRQRHPEAHYAVDAHWGCSLRWSMNEPSCGARHSCQAVSRQAQQALAIMTRGRRGERSGA